MALLSDTELVELVEGPAGARLVDDMPRARDWYNEASPIQPSSLDLTIGGIFVPGAKRNEPGAVTSPRRELYLRTGETAVVTTAEKLRVPRDLGGIGFPPSHVSFQGLLMTNPGHVDPGYVGRMRFTVINMGKSPYRLKKGDVIVTVLFIRVAGSVERDYAERGGKITDVTQEDVNRLASDFVDVENRARRIARATSIRAGAVLALIAVIVPAMMAAVQMWRPSWSYELQQQIGNLGAALSFKEKVVEIERNGQDISRLQQELRMIREATCQQTPKPRYCM